MKGIANFIQAHWCSATDTSVTETLHQVHGGNYARNTIEDIRREVQSGRGQSREKIFMVFSFRDTRRSIDEIPPLFVIRNEFHDVDSTLFGTFQRLLQCTMDYINHVLHACTDRDTVTDSDLAATHCPTTGAYWEQRHL